MFGALIQNMKAPSFCFPALIAWEAAYHHAVMWVDPIAIPHTQSVPAITVGSCIADVRFIAPWSAPRMTFKTISGRFFIHRYRRWQLQRVMRDQVKWDKAHHRPVFKWTVTVSNGAFTRHACSKWLIVAYFKARFNI